MKIISKAENLKTNLTHLFFLNMSFNEHSKVEVDYSILKLLAYYEIFKHPLKLDEIWVRLDLKGVSYQNVKSSLDRLYSEELIYKQGVYYSLKHHLKAIDNREDGELRAKKLMKIAKRMASLIYCFPFVRAVFISGSLSKGSVPEDADIDYFIITKKNRLWIARTMLVIFKRIFLLGSKEYFCVNYFVDEDNLEIPDKNIFTATEVSTLIPMRGEKHYQLFIKKNSWYRDFYPNLNLPYPNVTSNSGVSKKFSSTILEPLFFNALAEKLDKYFMKRTYNRWANMYGEGYSDKEFELAFRSKRGTSKNHNKNYQKKVLNTVEKNLAYARSQKKTEPVNG